MLDVRTEFHLYPQPYAADSPIAMYARDWPYPFAPRKGEYLHIGDSNWRIGHVQYMTDGTAVVKVYVETYFKWLPNMLLNEGFQLVPVETTD
jgi:hypothetical protein